MDFLPDLQFLWIPRPKVYDVIILSRAIIALATSLEILVQHLQPITFYQYVD